MPRSDGTAPHAWALAIAALTIGVLIYVTDRTRAGTSWLLPSAVDYIPLDWPAGVGGFFPSFAHTFAFATMSALVCKPRSGALGVCAAWTVVELLMEIAQMTPVTGAVASLASSNSGARLLTFAVSGTFAMPDVVAVLCGGVGAFTLVHTRQRRGST